MKKNIRLIALDLDGTLLTDKKCVTEHTKQVLQEAVKKGVIVMPATGRGITAIPDVVMNTVDFPYALTVNGAVVWELKKREKIYISYMDILTARKAMDYAFTMDTIPDVYLDGHAYSQRDRIAQLDRFAESEQQKQMLLSSRILVDDIREYMEKNPNQIEKVNVLFVNQEDRERARRHWSDEGEVETTFSMGNNLELNGKGVSKGKALLEFGKNIGIAREEIMVCGDSSNDIEMIKMAGFGVAMGNGNEEVKAIADFITKTNEEDGVAYAIEQFVL